MANNSPHDAADTRDARTGEGPTPTGDRVGAPMTSSEAVEARPIATPDDPVNAADASASPSSYTTEEVDSGETPLEEGMDVLIDPSLGGERMSNNLDVLDLDRSFIVESEEPDFMDDPGTSDVIEAIEEGETYFPPVDPPLRAGGRDGVSVMDGFAATSFEEPVEAEDAPSRVEGNDDELAERVRYALAADSYTTDLNIEVEVENRVAYLHGKVGSLDDIEQAEQIAGSVPGIEDVEEDLEIV